MKYGLIGRSLAHSYSAAIHGLLGNCEYELCEVPPESLDGFMRDADFLGINVTIPYKEAVMPYCEPDDITLRIGCVNTIVNKGGRLYGHNTDHFGFSFMVKNAGMDFAGRKVLVLGSGGASKTASCVARELGAREIVIVSRNGRDNYGNIARHADADILVNTTPVGMFPDGERSPVSLDLFANLCAVIDVVYNPLRTKLVLDARERGIAATGGLAMLVAQAVNAHGLFFSTDITATDSAALVPKIVREAELLFSNIVLVGMPGCGKTSVGRCLAEILEMDFIDTDLLIETNTGRKVPDIIREDGEPFFRDLERAAVAQASTGTRRVIATGGGSVLARENRDALLRNGTVVFLERDLAFLATADRPLSVDLGAMLAQRLPIYESICHHRVPVCGSPDPREVAREIARRVRDWF